MLRSAQSTTSDPQLRANGHVPVIGGRSGEILTRLRKQCTDRSSNTPGSPPPVSAELSCTVHLQASTLQSHYKCIVQLAQAVRLGVHRLHNRCTDVQGSAWDRTSISDTLFVLPTCLVDRLFTLLALTAWWCHHSS